MREIQVNNCTYISCKLKSLCHSGLQFSRLKSEVFVTIREDLSVCLCVPNTLLNHATQMNQTFHEGANKSVEGHCCRLSTIAFNFSNVICKQSNSDNEKFLII